MTSRELRELLGLSKPLLIAHIKVPASSGLLDYRVEVDESIGIARKLCRTRDFRLCLSRASLLREAVNSFDLGEEQWWSA